MSENAKKRIDKAINTVAIIAIATFFVGAIIGIWIGVIGFKIAASAIVLFIGDWVTTIWINSQNRRTKDRERRR